MKSEFVEALDAIEIKRGDMIYVSSDITSMIVHAKKRTSEFDRDKLLNEIVDAIQETVGNVGTVLFPLFSWSFCRGETFDYCRTPGEVGAFNNWVLSNRKDFKRTRHPLYSFLVWGKFKDFMCAMDNQESWGGDSPFDFLYKNNAKQLLIDVSLQKAFTFVHYVEQKVKVPYRFHKFFVGKYIDENNILSKRCYSMYVRDLEIQMKGYLPQEMLDYSGVSSFIECNGSKLWSVNILPLCDIIEDDLLKNSGRKCYIFNNYSMENDLSKRRCEIEWNING